MSSYKECVRKEGLKSRNLGSVKDGEEEVEKRIGDNFVGLKEKVNKTHKKKTQ